jgi:hypothetical protein
MDNITKGTITELKCITYFLELGYNISVPQKPARYDFILDTGRELLKVQVKTCHHRYSEEVINFATASRRRGRDGHVSHDYKFDGVDYFCTWYDGHCYLVPVEDCGRHEKNLRLVPTNNGQIKNIAFASDYIAESVIINRSK